MEALILLVLVPIILIIKLVNNMLTSTTDMEQTIDKANKLAEKLSK